MSSQPRSILILYGSQSGNSEELAEQAGKACSAQGLNPSVKAMDEIQITDLSSEDRKSWYAVALGGMANNQITRKIFGKQPDNANSGAISSLKGLNFSVLALGDTSYDLFCESGKEWDAWFEKMGANRVHQRVDCDVDFEGPGRGMDRCSHSTNGRNRRRSRCNGRRLLFNFRNRGYSGFIGNPNQDREVTMERKESILNENHPELCIKRRRIRKRDKTHRLRTWGLWFKLQSRGCSRCCP